MPPPTLALVTQKPFPASLREHATEMQEQVRQSEALRVALPNIERLCRPASNRFWVLGGEPGAFKTKLAWNVAVNLATLHRRVLFVSLEMHPARLTLMYAARASGLEERRVVNAFEKGGRAFDTREQNLFDSAMRSWSQLGDSLWIHSGERDGWTLRDVMHNCTRVTWDAIIVDHGRLLAQDDTKQVPQTVEALRRLSYGKGRKPFVLAVWPLNRDAPRDRTDDEEGPRMPKGSDFWGSSCVEYASDTAIVLQKRAKLDDDAAVVPVDAFVIKNRDGPFPMCVALDANGRTSLVTERGGPRVSLEPPDDREPGEEG